MLVLYKFKISFAVKCKMRIPFTYGKEVSDDDFTGRSLELKRLAENFISLKNTVLISPDGWGKTSLIKRAITFNQKIEQDSLFCFIDLKEVHEKEDFYQYQAGVILSTVFADHQSLSENAGKYLSRLYPKVKHIEKYHKNFSITLDREEVENYQEDVIDMTEKLAVTRGIKIIVCYKDFQKIMDFADPELFLKKFRKAADHHKHVCYCILSSGHSQIFLNEELPMFGFGDIIVLDKISSHDWIPFITARFANTGKSIDGSSAELILKLAGNQPQSVQILGQQAWLRTPYICNEKIIIEAHDCLIRSNKQNYHSIVCGLSKTQIYFLRAVLLGERHFNSQKVLINYKLGTSGNISKIKKGLTDKKIIGINRNEIEFLDPFFRTWLERYYFELIPKAYL